MNALAIDDIKKVHFSVKISIALIAIMVAMILISFFSSGSHKQIKTSSMDNVGMYLQ